MPGRNATPSRSGRMCGTRSRCRTFRKPLGIPCRCTADCERRPGRHTLVAYSPACRNFGIDVATSASLSPLMPKLHWRCRKITRPSGRESVTNWCMVLLIASGVPADHTLVASSPACRNFRDWVSQLHRLCRTFGHATDRHPETNWLMVLQAASGVGPSLGRCSGGTESPTARVPTWVVA